MLKNMCKLFVIVMGTIFLLGCYQHSVRDSQTVDNEKKPILVFTTGTSSIITDFQLQHPEVELEVVTIDPDDYDNDFENKVFKLGSPDIIIDTGIERGIQYWGNTDKCADIAAYLDVDTTYEQDDYYPCVSTVGMIGNELIGLPLGLSIDYMTIREDMWNHSEFKYLDDEYTAEKLLNAIERELDYQNEYSEEGILYQVFGDWRGDYLFLLWDYGAIDISDDNVILDEDVFSLVCRINEKHNLNFTYANQQGGTSNTKVSPLENGANYILTTWFNSGINKGVAPQIGIVYAESINMEVFGQNTKVIFQPMKQQENEREYAARVNVWGMVGSQSERKEEAYQVLRAMMDVKLGVYNQVDGQYDIPFSVNRELALEMIDTVEENVPGSYTVTGNDGSTQEINRQTMSEQNRKELEKVLNNITKIYSVDMELQDQMFDIIFPYMQAGGDYKICYDQVLELLHNYVNCTIKEVHPNS